MLGRVGSGIEAGEGEEEEEEVGSIISSFSKPVRVRAMFELCSLSCQARLARLLPGAPLVNVSRVAE